jgi:hypothetical protein
LGVDLVVVGSRENAQVVCSSDGGSVLRSLVSDGSGVSGDGGLLHIVTSLGTSQETIVANNGIEVGGWALNEVKECASVEVWLLEVKVDLGGGGLAGWEETTEDLSLEALGNGVVKLNLGVKSVGGVPGLGEGQAWTSVKH